MPVKTHRGIKVLLTAFCLLLFNYTDAQQLTSAGKPAQLEIRPAGAHSIRITLKPISFKPDFVYTPALADKKYGPAILKIKQLNKPVKKTMSNLTVLVTN